MIKGFAANNLMLLRSQYPNIYERVRNQTYDSRYVQIARNRLDQTILHITGSDGRLQPMYSRYDVKVEAGRWLDSIAGDVYEDNILFFGIGLGYHLQAFIDRYPDKTIYLYEPDINVFMAAIESIDLRDLLNHKKVAVLALGDEDHIHRSLLKAVFDTIKGSFSPIIPPIFGKLYADTVQRLQKAISSFALSYRANLQTFSSLQLEWAESTILNLDKVINSYSFAPMKDQARGVPALVVGSGPSLDMEIEWVKKMKNRALIIAAGSSIQGLLHHGIEPDLVIAMDPRAGQLAIFNNIDHREVPFLFIPTAHFAILQKEWTIKIHALFLSDYLTNYLLSGVNNDILPPTFLSTSTVTGTAIQAAVFLGCNEIVMIGQDFSYPEDRHYAQGVSHKSSEDLNTKVRSADLEVENVNGGKNRTSKSMQALKQDVEALLEIVVFEQVYNASQVGAVIKRTKSKTLEQLYNEQQHVQFEQGWFKDLLREKLEPYSETTKKQIVRRIREMDKAMEDLHRLSDKIESHLKDIDNIQAQDVKRIKNWLAAFNEKWDPFIKHSSYSALFKYLLYREHNYVARFWADTHAGVDDLAKVQQISQLTRIILNGFYQVTEVIRSKMEQLPDDLRK